MTRISLFRHPFAGGLTEPELFEVDSLAEWLLVTYEGKPRRGVHIFAGQPSAATDISTDAEAILRCDAPEYTVLESPGTGLEPWLMAAIQNFAISMVLNVAVNLLFGKKERPAGNRTQESPNNQLSNRENRVRALERVEDIYGTVRAIPSLMMPTYIKWIQHRRVEYGLYCVSRGYCDISDVRDGETLLSAITGASAAVYAPFTSPNSGTPQLQIGDPIIDSVVTVARSTSVDGLVLKPTNQLQMASGMRYSFVGPGPGLGVYGIPASSYDIVWQAEADRKPNLAAIAEVGQTITISMPDTKVTRVAETNATVSVTGGNTFNAQAGTFTGALVGSAVTVNAVSLSAGNTGAKTVVSVSADGASVQVSEALTDEGPIPLTSVDVVVNFSGTREIVGVGNAYLELIGPSEYSPRIVVLDTGTEVGDSIALDLTVNNSLTDWTDWITLSQTDRTEVWANVVAYGGVYRDDGAKSATTVAYELQIEQLDASLAPTGVVETITGSLSGSTSNERAETLEQVTSWTGPCRVRVRRTTPFDYNFGGLVVDEIQWADLYGVSPVNKLHFGNKTIVHTVTMATSRAAAVRRRELNCLASRKLPTYDGSTWSGVLNPDGSLASGTISATSRIVDIIAAVTQDRHIGNRALDDIDLAQIWGVQQQLDAWNGECGQFNHTFDSDAISYEETLNAIAQAAFSVPYRQNGKIRLALDRPQADSTALFTHRNKKPRSETITRSFQSDSDYDGVELVYEDPETESRETIRLPLDGSYTKLKKIEPAGVRNYTQAWMHANREYNRLRSQRMKLETVTTTDARALLPNSRISVVDNTRFKSYDGEIVAQDGLTLTLSRDVVFLPSTPHSIILMRRDGSQQSIACTEVAGAPNKVLLASLPSEAVVTEITPEGGIRTIFSFAADSARGAQAWLVQGLEFTEDGYVRVSAINYADAYYTADSQAVPAKEGVIN